MDYFMNGQAYGDVATALLAANGDVNVLRPWIGADGRAWMTVNGADGKPIAVPTINNTAALRKDDWVAMDEAILKVAKPRLKLVGDLRAAGLEYTVPDGMGKTVLQHERMTDVGPATLSMDGLRQGDSARPLFDIQNLPLPIITQDFQYPLRQILASRNGGSPLDTTTATAAARRCAELAEMLHIGTYGSYAFGGGTAYGLLNFPNRITNAGTNHYAPTNGSYTTATALAEVQAMKQASINHNHYGPWVLYNSLAWDQYMDADYNLYKGITLRERLKMIDGIKDVRTLDYLQGVGGTDTFRLLLVEQNPEVVQTVIGMDFTTVQWESHGGLLLNFKVMAIMVPRVRADINNNTGLVDNTQS